MLISIGKEIVPLCAFIYKRCLLQSSKKKMALKYLRATLYSGTICGPSKRCIMDAITKRLFNQYS